ncbi:histone-like protein 18C [Drosophila miranda]|uniref:histone-like protein 18C n=1 Tax=Drosophila miranda TaxID=7229 RepID=UPI0007E67E7E|nr:histone-like protein 18C [Drosophila miranda]XP_033246243.1 histone-like protein 18C [Drosophila miranda]
MSVSSVNSSNEFTSSIELEVDNAQPSSETELGSSDVDVALPDSSRRSSAVAFLNYMRECKRRFGSKHLGQGFANAATQRWRAMSPEHRARYRRSGYRSASSIAPSEQSKSSLLCRKVRSLYSTGSLSVVPSGFSLDEVDCGMKRKSKRSCGKSKRKKSACGKRRRRKSACKKRKSRKSKKSCSKPRRRKSRKAKCKKGDDPH